jgi:hypothetical protein
MRPGRMQAMRSALAALVVFFAAAAGVSAQVLVVPERDLQFGLLTPGTSTAVAPTDVVRSAQLRIVGRGTYQVTFQLPSALTNAMGHQIPMAFGPADGQLVIRNKISTFDPNTTISFRVNPAESEAQLNLGGSALPALGQPAGSYTATIVMMVVQTGT